METKAFKIVVNVILVISFTITLMGLASVRIPEINLFIDEILKHENLYLVTGIFLLLSSFDKIIGLPPKIRYS
jgi:hypothetical protein